ncbi:MAG: hypothetical protein ACI9HK_002633 [Pirellulaceae bacterium]|jgi:hypothetical protein
MSELLLLLLSSLAAEPADTVVVCAPSFQPAMSLWLEHRRSQGHRIQIVPNNQSAEEIRKVIRGVAAAGKLKAILLVGDVPSAQPNEAATQTATIPTHYAQAKINIHWGSEPQIASDNWYADLDDDQVPEVAIGRLTADTPEDVKAMTSKIIDYEKNGQGDWCRRVNFIAGVGGFGALADSVLEMSTKSFLTSGIPSPYATTMTYGSWRSPYCPDPRQFHQASIDRFNEGCLFWVYIGHGQKWYLDRVQVPGGSYHIMDVRDVKLLQCKQGSPIAVFLACYTGAYDAPQDCLAERMLRQPGGPVAVLSGSRVTMPYAMAVMGEGLLTEYFKNRQLTLGDAILATKRKMMTPDENNENRRMMDAIAATISPVRDKLDLERKEHLSLFNLLGDPLLRLPHPAEVKLETEFNTVAGDNIQIKGESPLDGLMTIELVVRRDRTRQRAPARPKYVSAAETLAGYMDTYEKANDPRWTAIQLQVKKGPFQCQLTIPDGARSLCHVRAIVQTTDRQLGLGACDVFVKRRKPVSE